MDAEDVLYRGLSSLLKYPVGRTFAKVPVASPTGDSGGRHWSSRQRGQDPTAAPLAHPLQEPLRTVEGTWLCHRGQ